MQSRELIQPRVESRQSRATLRDLRVRATDRPSSECPTVISHPSSGFTLLELLTVIAIIGIMIGVIGFAFRGGSEGIGLQAAQSAMSSMVSAARSRAVLTDTTVRVIVNYNTASGNDRLLRFVALIAMDPANSSPTQAQLDDASNWKSVGVPILLPKGVAIIPPLANASLPTRAGTALPSFNALTTNLLNPTAIHWNWDAYSSPPATFNLVSAAPSGTEAYFCFTISPRIMQGVGSSTGSWIASPASPVAGGGIEFSNYHAVRGVYLSNYGVPRLISDESGF